MPDLKDKYANVFQVTMTESAANTLTFGEINLGLTIFQKRAILISRISIDWNQDTLQQLQAIEDTVLIGITQSDQLTTIQYEDPATIWKAQKGNYTFGTSGNAVIENITESFDLSTIPGGGEFITPKPLYWAIQSQSVTNPNTVTMRFYFQVVELKPDEYFELLESRRFFN